MDERNETPGWKIAVIGLAVGWIVGMVWWVGFLLAGHPGYDRDEVSGQLVERQRISASEAMWTPVVALPWAVIGLLVGGCSALVRGYWIPITSVIGTIVGFAWCIATSPFDGWLAIMVPVSALGGTLVGFLAGVASSAVWGMIMGCDD